MCIFRWDSHHYKLSTTFVPLVYLFCLQHESDGACLMLMDAANILATKYFGAPLDPGATCSDHTESFRKGYVATWPNAVFVQCWPHIFRKFVQGEYVSKTWEHYEEAKYHLRCIHFAQTPEMKVLLVEAIGEVNT